MSKPDWNEPYRDRALLKPCLTCGAEVGQECPPSPQCLASYYARYCGVALTIESLP